MTSRTLGLTRATVPTNTVGTVSSPPVTERTRSAAPRSSQMLISVVDMPRRHSPRRSRLQNGQPGRHNTSMPSTWPALLTAPSSLTDIHTAQRSASAVRRRRLTVRRHPKTAATPMITARITTIGKMPTAPTAEDIAC